MAERRIDSFEDVHPLTRAEWRRWLKKNYEKSPGAWFVYYKKHTGKPRVEYEAAVEEALCFGWIDSLARGLDEERSKLLMTPRKAKSVWSKPNKGRVDRIVAEGLMTSAGQAKIDQAKADGSWNTLDSSDRLEIPEDLEQAFTGNETARIKWNGFAPSARKAILYWLGTAKREETRAARVEKIVSMAEIGKRANFDK
jgi:uncharacterized protein YdeI (YjbR/CyaY-like superfamily)